MFVQARPPPHVSDQFDETQFVIQQQQQKNRISNLISTKKKLNNNLIQTQINNHFLQILEYFAFIIKLILVLWYALLLS
jgi:hypothetical protein